MGATRCPLRRELREESKQNSSEHWGKTLSKAMQSVKEVPCRIWEPCQLVQLPNIAEKTTQVPGYELDFHATCHHLTALPASHVMLAMASLMQILLTCLYNGRASTDSATKHGLSQTRLTLNGQAVEKYLWTLAPPEPPTSEEQVMRDRYQAHLADEQRAKKAKAKEVSQLSIYQNSSHDIA